MPNPTTMLSKAEKPSVRGANGEMFEALMREIGDLRGHMLRLERAILRVEGKVEALTPKDSHLSRTPVCNEDDIPF